MNTLVHNDVYLNLTDKLMFNQFQWLLVSLLIT